MPRRSLRAFARHGEVRVSRTLDTVPPGHTVLLARIDGALASDFREQLAAYGFVPGRALEVLAQQPMTVVVCDHVELAVETAIARSLVVREAATAA
jgi:Fe2+ transport system protein FeoA